VSDEMSSSRCYYVMSCKDSCVIIMIYGLVLVCGMQSCPIALASALDSWLMFHPLPHSFGLRISVLFNICVCVF